MNDITAVLLIDGAHYDRLRSTFETRLDFGALGQHVAGNDTAIVTRYYRDVRDAQEMTRFSGFRVWLEEHGISVVGRSELLDSPGPRQRYGTNLLEFAADAQRFACHGKSIFLVASDIQLTPVVEAIREGGTSVTIISTLFAPPSIAPHETLLEAASHFIELRDLLPQIALD